MKEEAIRRAAKYFVEELKPAYDYHFKLLEITPKFSNKKESAEEFIIKYKQALEDQKKAKELIEIKQAQLEILKEGFNGVEIKKMDNIIKENLKIKKIQDF